MAALSAMFPAAAGMFVSSHDPFRPRRSRRIIRDAKSANDGGGGEKTKKSEERDSSLPSSQRWRISRKLGRSSGTYPPLEGAELGEAGEIAGVGGNDGGGMGKNEGKQS